MIMGLRESTPDWTAFRKSLPGPTPAGKPVRFGESYRQLREARREDDPTLPRGDWQRELKQADWAEVERIATEVLTGESKDLRFAVWLMEAWVHRRGFEGVAWGFELLLLLCQGFWDTAHPEWDPADPEGRVAPFDWVDQKIPLVLRLVPLTAAAGFDPLTWADWMLALYWERVALRGDQGKGPDPDLASRASFQFAVGRTGPRFYSDVVAHLKAAEEKAEALERLLDGRFGQDGPSLRSVRSEMAEIRSWAELVLADMPGQTPTPVDEEEHGMEDTGTPPDGPVRNRADAYARMMEAADYLLRTEPHSPVPYLVKRAVAWGDLTLAELLQEFVREGLNLDAVCHLLGIRTAGKR